MPKDFSAQITSVQQCFYSIAQVFLATVFKVERNLTMLTVPM
jgi:hypothetical protein